MEITGLDRGGGTARRTASTGSGKEEQHWPIETSLRVLNRDRDMGETGKGYACVRQQGDKEFFIEAGEQREQHHVRGTVTESSSDPSKR